MLQCTVEGCSVILPANYEIASQHFKEIHKNLDKITELVRKYQGQLSKRKEELKEVLKSNGGCLKKEGMFILFPDAPPKMAV